MGHKHVKFKESQLYTWESEPVDERPSEFMSSTGYASLSGYHSAIDPVRQVRRGNRFGLAGMLAVALAFIAAGGWVIVRFAPLLHR